MLERSDVTGIQKGVEAIYKMSADERTKELIRMREKALHDKASELGAARRKGIAEGEAKREAEIEAQMRADGLAEDVIQKYLKRK